jgi:hypothetical protein
VLFPLSIYDEGVVTGWCYSLGDAKAVGCVFRECPREVCSAKLYATALGAVVDGLLAVLVDGHNQVVWPLPDKALVNLQRPSCRVEEACRIDEVFVFAAYRVRDFDEAVTLRQQELNSIAEELGYRGI